MKLRPRSAVLSAVLAATVVACALTATAQANVQLPGLNARIAFTSNQAFPPQPAPKGTGCFNNQSCSDEIYSMNPDGGDQVRLTNNQVFDDEPAWLPADGANIAFESDTCPTEKIIALCSDKLWSMTSSGGSLAQLTFDQGDQDHPSYSPDGSKIAYTQFSQEKVLSARGGLGQVGSSIMVVPSAGESGGGVPVSLIPPVDPGPNTFLEDALPAWSPDGTQIAFTRFQESEIPDSPADGEGSAQPGFTLIFDERTYVAPASGGGPAHPIETYPSCSVHIFGQALGLQADVTRSLKAGTRAGSGLAARLKASFCIGDEKPAWSPDGSKFAVQRQTTGDLSQLDVARGTTVPLIDNGDIAVFNSSDGSGDTDLSDLSEPANCNDSLDPKTSCSTDEYPDWSPDSTKIVFDSDRLGAGDASESCRATETARGLENLSCNDEIWTMNADGSNVTQLTSVGDNFDPDWQRIPSPPVAPPATPAAVKPKVGVAGVRRACVSSAFHVRFRVTTANSSVKKVVVKLDGKRIKSTSKSSFTLSINSKKLKSGKHRLTITATNAAGQVTTTRKTFSVCKAAKPRHKAAPRFTG
jgi:Tol biopolymer transport system component